MLKKFLFKRISSILIPKSSAKNTRKTNSKRRNRIIFSPPDEILQRSERKRKVVHQKDDKNKAIILRYIVFQLCKFITNLVLSPGVRWKLNKTQQNIFEGSEDINKQRASIKSGTWNIPEHSGTSRNIPEHRIIMIIMRKMRKIKFWAC